MIPKTNLKPYLAVNFVCSHYCTSYDRGVNVSNLTGSDDQCLPGRKGVLCGACKPGLSHVLGSPTKCKSMFKLESLVPDYYFSTLWCVHSYPVNTS